MWTPATLLFAAVAVIVATGPVLYAIGHSARFGHHASLFERGHARDPQRFGWSTCPDCSALTTDLAGHVAAVHPTTAPVAAGASTATPAPVGAHLVEVQSGPGPRAILAGQRSVAPAAG